MFRVHFDPVHEVLEMRVEGTVREDEMQRFMQESLRAVRELRDQKRSIRVLSDLRLLRAASPEATEVLRQGQETAMRVMGSARIAELVSSEVTTLQISRVARQSGMERIVRRFSDEAEARRWLLE